MNERPDQPSPEIDWDRLHPLIDDAICQLGAVEREAVLLRCVERRSFAEIGATLQLNEDAARKRVDRALDKLRAWLGRRGITSTAAAVGTVLAMDSALGASANLAATVAGNALTQAALAGTAGLPATLYFMSTLKTIVLGSVALVLGGIVVGETILLRQQQVEMAGLHAAAIADAADRRHLQQQVAESGDRLKQLQGELARVESASGPKPATPPRADVSSATLVAAALAALADEIPRNLTVNEARQLMENPEFRQNLAALARVRLDTLYAPLFQKLQLPDDALDRLKDLIVEKQQMRSDAANAARASGVNRQLPAFYQAIDETESATNNQIKGLLGDAGFSRYVDYERTFSSRTTVNQLRDSLNQTAEPLTLAQQEQLVDLIARTAPPRPDATTGLSSEVGGGLFPEPVSGIATAAIEESRAFLSPSQVGALSRLQTQMALHRRLLELSRKAR